MDKKRQVQKRRLTSNSFIDFTRKYSSEKVCREKFKEYKEMVGVVCPKCGCTHHYWKGWKVQRHQCKNCGYQQSLRSNTIMHYSKLPFKYFFIAMWIVVNQKNTISACEMQRQIGHKYYRPIYMLMRKLRTAMANDNDRVILKNVVEVDEAFYSTQIKVDDKPTTTRKGEKLLQKNPYLHTKTRVVVMAESIPVTNPKKKYQIHRACGKIRFAVVSDNKAVTIADAVADKISASATVVSDGTSAHKHFPKMFRGYIGRKYKKDEVSQYLPYVHIAIGNTKALLRNVHHCVSREFLQTYLSEWEWRFNHRNSDNKMNDILMAAARYVA